MMTKTLHVILLITNISLSAGGKIFDGKLRAGNQLVVDIYDGKAVEDVDKLEIKDEELYYQCEKNCISTHRNNKCKTCTVNESVDDKPVFCNGGTLPLACKNRCCTEIAKPNKRIHGKDRVQDFHGEENEDRDELLVAYSCKKTCIARKEECDECVLDVNLHLFCTDGKISSECLEECCKLA